MDKITPKTLFTDLRKFSDNGAGSDPAEMWLVHHRNEWWLGNPFFFVKPSPVSLGTLDELLRINNLTLEPLSFTATIAVTRVEGSLPDIEKIMPAMYECLAISPHPCGPAVLSRASEDDPLVEMWRREDGEWANVNADVSLFVKRHAKPASWMQTKKPSGQIIGVDQFGEMCAVLAPVNFPDRALLRDPDLPPQLFDL